MSWLRVKICCISSPEEAKMALEAGADTLGLVSEMPSGPGVIDESEIAEITQAVPTDIESFLLTSRRDAESIGRQFDETGVTTLQLVDKVGVQNLREIRERCPSARLVQVLHVESEAQIEEARAIESVVDAILLDSGRPGADIPELGGTGRTHNWNISREICSTVSVPVYLAGGLKPENVSSAVEAVQPYGVDLCSGVRSKNRLDPEKLDRFFREVQTFRSNRPS